MGRQGGGHVGRLSWLPGRSSCRKSCFRRFFSWKAKWPIGGGKSPALKWRTGGGTEMEELRQEERMRWGDRGSKYPTYWENERLGRSRLVTEGRGQASSDVWDKASPFVWDSKPKWEAKHWEAKAGWDANEWEADEWEAAPITPCPELPSPLPPPPQLPPPHFPPPPPPPCQPELQAPWDSTAGGLAGWPSPEGRLW